MQLFTGFLAVTLAILVITVNGQISTPCTASMISSFAPCVNFVTGSSSNGRSPTTSCCAAVESLMNNSMECTCLIVTGNVPVSLPSPISQALAITLPKASTGVPLPPAGPPLFVPPPPKIPPPRPLPPAADSPDLPPSPSGSKSAVLAPEPSEMTQSDLPEPDTREVSDAPPASAPFAQKGPMVDSGIRPVLTTESASNPLLVSQPVLLLTLVSIIMMNFHEVFDFRCIL